MFVGHRRVSKLKLFTVPIYTINSADKTTLLLRNSPPGLKDYIGTKNKEK